MLLSNYLAVGLGGAIGSIARVALSKVLPLEAVGVPTQILCVNIIGCFLIGLLTELLALHWSVSLNMRYFLISGFLGGFTTFSAFALEFGLLFEKSEHLLAMTYATLSVLFSIIFFFAGLKVVRVFS